jgi:hypothetical protein
MVNSKNIGCESYFYDLSQDDDQQMEKTLGWAESLFCSAYNKLIATEDLGCLTSSEKISMACFVATQELRTKEHRAMLKNMVKAIEEKTFQIAEGFPKEKVREAVEEKLGDPNSEEDIKYWQLSSLTNVRRYADIVCKMKWVLLINRTAMPFWSSDHPVNRHNDIDMRPYGNLGLSCKGIQIHFPLCPTASLSLLDPSMYASFPSYYEVKDIRNIEFANSLQVYGCTRYVFSNQNDFSLAEKMIKDSPSLADIDRKRVSAY